MTHSDMVLKEENYCVTKKPLDINIDGSIKPMSQPRLITKSSYDASVDPFLRCLADGTGSHLVEQNKKRLVIMFTTLNKLNPPFMQDLFSARNCSYSIRYSENNQQIT